MGVQQKEESEGRACLIRPISTMYSYEIDMGGKKYIVNATQIAGVEGYNIIACDKGGLSIYGDLLSELEDIVKQDIANRLKK